MAAWIRDQRPPRLDSQDLFTGQQESRAIKGILASPRWTGENDTELARKCIEASCLLIHCRAVEAEELQAVAPQPCDPISNAIDLCIVLRTSESRFVLLNCVHPFPFSGKSKSDGVSADSAHDIENDRPPSWRSFCDMLSDCAWIDQYPVRARMRGSHT